MKISYLMTAPPPVVPGTDAVIQEAEWLCSRIGGELSYLFPFFRPRPVFPRAFYGFHNLGMLRELDRRADLHHVFHAELYPFPVLRLLQKPVVYSVVSGTAGQKRLPALRTLRRLGRIVVPSQRDLTRLQAHTLINGEIVQPGVDISRFHPEPPPSGKDFALLVGSAPWTKKQFQTKGVDALLRAAQRTASLRLVFLWRGLLGDELVTRIRERGLSERVEIIDTWVDVDKILARVHAAVVLADKPKLVKAFPQSLLEALACGRPVLVSDCLAMAHYVEDRACGQVVRGVDEADLSQKIALLRKDYDAKRKNALREGRGHFSKHGRIEVYRELYESVLNQG
jgi:glycosyltransferase involved in cell wall biosynthesis